MKDETVDNIAPTALRSVVRPVSTCGTERASINALTGLTVRESPLMCRKYLNVSYINCLALCHNYDTEQDN